MSSSRLRRAGRDRFGPRLSLQFLEERVVPASLLHSLYPVNAGYELFVEFGNAVAIEGQHRVVAAYRANSVFVFQGNSTQVVNTILAPEPALAGEFGAALAISQGRVVVGDPDYDDANVANSGSAWVYDLNSATPTIPIAHLKQPNAKANDSFGQAVAISNQYVVVGAYGSDNGATDAGVAYVYDLNSVTPSLPIAILANPSASKEDHFGISVAVSGSIVIVGASRDSTGASGAGSVYVFDVNSVTPSASIATINNPTPYQSDEFGCALAASDNRLVVGASGASPDNSHSGSAYVYDINNPANPAPVVTLENPTPESNDHFGDAVAVSGQHVVVGCVWDDANGPAGSGSIYTYDLTSPSPDVPIVSAHSPTKGPIDFFGRSVAISGNVVLAGSRDSYIASGAGSAYLYDLTSPAPATPTTHLTKAYPAAYDGMGFAVAITDRYVVSLQEQDGRAYVHDLSSATPTVPLLYFTNQGAFTNGFPGSLVAGDGDLIVIGAPSYNSKIGAAYVYDMSAANPTQPMLTLINPTPSSGDFFGVSVAIAGKYVVVGANYDDALGQDSGAAYVYNLESATPATPVATIRNPTPAVSDGFGRSVAVVGKYVAIGSVADDTGAANSGSAYLYDIETSTPTIPILSFHNPFPNVDDNFSASIAMAGKYLAIGAYSDDTGASNSGSVYVYDLGSATPTLPIVSLNNPSPGISDQFGYALSMSGSKIMVGAPYDDSGGGVYGSAYVYDLNAVAPTIPVDIVSNPTPASGDTFGYAVGISGSKFVVGAFRDDTQNLNEGASYVYTLAPAQIATVSLNKNSPQRSRVTSVEIEFDQHVQFNGAPLDSFELKRQFDGKLVTCVASVNDSGSRTVITLTFNGGPVEFGSLTDGRYTLTVFASLITTANGHLDGNADGFGGDNYVLVGTPANGLFRLFGDSNGDAKVTATDYNAFRMAWATNDTTFDFNNDGIITAADYSQFRLRYGMVI